MRRTQRTHRTVLPFVPCGSKSPVGVLAGIAALAFAGAVLLAASPVTAQATHEPPSELGTVRAPRAILGDVVPFGSGTARSWVEVDGAGEPTTIGITLTEAALHGLPAEVTPGLIWVVEYILSFPAEVPMLPFNHIGVNWNPKGHVPNGIYNTPHFDFHFYTITPEQRSGITARGEDLEKCRRTPMADHVPEGYVFAPESEEPGMGGHWIDPESHEFHGEDFTTTFIYGSYDGDVIFYEPMITRAYLESKPDVEIPVRVPKKYSVSGYYPSGYSVRFDPVREEYVVALEGMTFREAG